MALGMGFGSGKRFLGGCQAGLVELAFGKDGALFQALFPATRELAQVLGKAQLQCSALLVHALHLLQKEGRTVQPLNHLVWKEKVKKVEEMR